MFFTTQDTYAVVNTFWSPIVQCKVIDNYKEVK